MKPQTKRILDYMERFGSITPMQALQDCGCFRLASRIAELKKEGYAIESEYITQVNRLGEDVSFKKYRLGASE